MSFVVDPSTHLFWLGSRALGIVGLLLTSTSVGLGLALSTRLGRLPGSAARLKVIHEAAALVSLAAIAGHGLLLLADPYLHPTVAQIAVPFLIGRDPFWTGLGIVAGWLALLFTASFYLRNFIGVRTWRRLHRWTILVFFLGLAHTLGSGTDAGSTWLLALIATAAIPVVMIGALRLGRLGQPRAGAGPRRPDRDRPRTALGARAGGGAARSAGPV